MEQQLASILAKLAKLKILDEIKATALQQAADLRDCKASFDLATPTHTTCSTDGRGLDTDEDGSVDVVPELAAPVVCDAGHGVVAIDTTGLAAPTPLTCSTKCSNQVGATSFPSPVTTASLLPAATRELVADLVCPATNPVDLMQPFRKHDLDVSPPTRHEGLLLWPTPWPSFWMDHAEGNEVRPIPWPSFLIGRFLEHLILFVQVHDSGWISSTFPMELSHVGNLVCDLPGNCIRILPGQLLCLWSLQQDNADSCLNTHVKLFHYSKQLFSELCAFTKQGQLTFLVSTEHDCGSEMICAGAHPETNSKDFTIQSALPSSFEQLQWGIPWTLSFVRKTTDCRPCLRHNFQFLLPPGNPRVVQVWFDLHIVEFIEHQFINHAHISELAACFCLEKLWGTSDLVYKSQEQWKFCEHRGIEHDAAVCNFSRPDKLKGTMQIMNMSVQWQFLSREKFASSNCFAKECSSEQEGTQWQSPCLLEQATSNVKFSSPECCSQIVVQKPLTLEHVAVGRMPRGDKLQRTIQIMSMAGSESEFAIYLESLHSDLLSNKAGDEQWNSVAILTQYDHVWACSSEQHGILSVSDTSQVAFSTAGASVHSCSAAKQDHCHLDYARAICEQDQCHLDVKDFYELSSTNGCLTSELPIQHVSYEQGYGVLYTVLEGQNLPEHKSGKDRIVSILFSHAATTTFETRPNQLRELFQHREQGDIFSEFSLPPWFLLPLVLELPLWWDPGGGKFSESFMQAEAKGGMNNKSTAYYVDHFFYFELACDFDQVHVSHNYYSAGLFSFNFAQVHLNHDYFRDGSDHDYSRTRERQGPWDPGGNSLASAWGQAEFQGGTIVSDPCLGRGWAGTWAVGDGLAHCATSHYKSLEASVDQFIRMDQADGWLLLPPGFLPFPSRL